MFAIFIALIVVYTTDISLVIVAQKKKLSNTVKLSPAFFWIGIVGLTITLPVSIIAILVFHEIAYGFVCVIAAVVFSLLILAFYGFKVEYNEKSINYRYFFEHQKSIEIKEIKQMRNGLDLVISTQNSKLIIRNYMSGKEELYLFLQKKVSVRNQKEVPNVIRFADAVERPGEFVFMYVLMCVLSIAMIIIILFVKPAGFYLAFFIILASLFPLIVVLSVLSAKRAHSSNFWCSIARILFRKGYLRTDEIEGKDSRKK